MPIKKQILLTILPLVFFISSLKAQDGHPVPSANFEVTNLCYKSVTNFSNTSTNLDAAIFEWTIRQMGVSTPIYTSSAADINFQFPVKTTYTVSLSVVNYVSATHSHSDITDKVIFIDSIPIANFDFKPCQNKFTNLSCCANSFTWSFGDSSPTSTVTSPVHSYSASNFYTATLTASDGAITDTAANSIFTYENFLTASFSYSIDPDSVTFRSDYDSLKGTGCDWEWDYGDGQTLDMFGTNGWINKHKFPVSERDSVYTVSLFVFDICFAAKDEKNILIKGIGKDVKGTHVFPSPVVHGYLNIESSEKDKITEIKLIDCLGKQLNNYVVSEKPYGYYMYIGQIANGMYTVQLIFKDHIENHKIIKQSP